MTETTARRLQVASLIRQLRSMEPDIWRVAGTDDSAQGECIRLAADDVRSATEALERAMAAMRNEQCARLGGRARRRSLWRAIEPLLWVAAAMGLIALAEGWLQGAGR